jgi:hypothetical protein
MVGASRRPVALFGEASSSVELRRVADLNITKPDRRRHRASERWRQPWVIHERVTCAQPLVRAKAANAVKAEGRWPEVEEVEFRASPSPYRRSLDRRVEGRCFLSASWGTPFEEFHFFHFLLPRHRGAGKRGPRSLDWPVRWGQPSAARSGVALDQPGASLDCSNSPTTAVFDECYSG